MASFWDRAITEFNVAKALASSSYALRGQDSEARVGLPHDVGLRQKLGKKQEKERSSPECISYKTFAHCVLGTIEVSDAEERQCWSEFEHILEDCGRASHAWGSRTCLSRCSTEEKK